MLPECHHETTYIGCPSCVSRYVAEREAEDRSVRESLLTDALERMRLEYLIRGPQDRRSVFASPIDWQIREWAK